MRFSDPTLACIIPARLNSSRFPSKLLAIAGGKTVLQRTFESALETFGVDRVYLATDSESLADPIRALGGKVIKTSSEPRDGTERAIEAIQRSKELQAAKTIFILQGDHPCVSPKTIEKVVLALLENKEAVLSSAAYRIKTRDDFLSPHIVKCLFDANGKALYFSRSPIPYTPENSPLEAFAHIGLYCYRRSFLEEISSLKPTPLQKIEDLEQLKILESGYRIQIALVEEDTPSVDTPLDLVKLEQYLCKNR